MATLMPKRGSGCSRGHRKEVAACVAVGIEALGLGRVERGGKLAGERVQLR